MMLQLIDGWPSTGQAFVRRLVMWTAIMVWCTRQTAISPGSIHEPTAPHWSGNWPELTDLRWLRTALRSRTRWRGRAPRYRDAVLAPLPGLSGTATSGAECSGPGPLAQQPDAVCATGFSRARRWRRPALQCGLRGVPEADPPAVQAPAGPAGVLPLLPRPAAGEI